MSKGTHHFVCLVIGLIIVIGLVLFIRLVWISEQDPISRPSWDAKERNEKVSELRGTARKASIEIPQIRATISTLPSEREMLALIRTVDAAVEPLPQNNLTEAQLDRTSQQLANSILTKVDATSVAGWHDHGTRVAGRATAASKDLELYEDSVEHFERESAARRDFWIFVAAVVGIVILLIAVAVARNRQMRALREQHVHGNPTRENMQSDDAIRESRERRVWERHEQRESKRLAQEKTQSDGADREARERRVRERHEQRERERFARKRMQSEDEAREIRERRVRELHEQRERRRPRIDRT